MAPSQINPELSIETVTIGGSENHTSVTVGGQKSMPYLGDKSDYPYRPRIAMEFWDTAPKDWNPFLAEEFSQYFGQPVKWAQYLTETHGAELLFLRIMQPHPDYGEFSEKALKATVSEILEKVKTPLIITGTGVLELDREILPLLAKTASGRNLLLGNATADCYREAVEACIKYNHSLITESPIDINMAKQINILAEDAGLPPDRIVMYATTGALGYGLEYAYSIMEKTRLSGLEGDRYMNKPQIAFVGQETWRSRESAVSPAQAVMWETITAQAYIHAGADIVVLRHPQSARNVEEVL